MNIVLNGRGHEAPEAATLGALLEALQIASAQIAVEVNGRVVPRAEVPRHVLRADDRVEIVRFVGGG
jgi:thiamine biosynthesis protein ThiS